MKRTLVVFIVGVVLFGAFSAQRADAQNANIAQRIIGTWVDQDGDSWVFNANGTVTIAGNVEKFGIIDTKLAILEEDKSLAIFNCTMSSDGKQLILEGTWRSGESLYGGSWWLIKK